MRRFGAVNLGGVSTVLNVADSGTLARARDDGQIRCLVKFRPFGIDRDAILVKGAHFEGTIHVRLRHFLLRIVHVRQGRVRAIAHEAIEAGPLRRGRTGIEAPPMSDVQRLAYKSIGDKGAKTIGRALDSNLAHTGVGPGAPMVIAEG